MRTLPTLTLALICGLAACRNAEQRDTTSQTPMTSNDTNIIKKSDTTMNAEDNRTFLQNAAIGGLTEVEVSGLVMVRSKDPEIVAHAKMISDDHQKASKKLEQIARDLGYQLPKVLPEKKMKLVKQIEALENDGLNENYVLLMINEHREAIDLFKMGSRVENPQISQFASEILPTLQHHYDQSVKLRDKIANSKVNMGDDRLKLSDKSKQQQ